MKFRVNIHYMMIPDKIMTIDSLEDLVALADDDNVLISRAEDGKGYDYVLRVGYGNHG